MRKLKLDLSALSVQGFDTSAGPQFAEMRGGCDTGDHYSCRMQTEASPNGTNCGTVEGHGQSYEYLSECGEDYQTATSSCPQGGVIGHQMDDDPFVAGSQTEPPAEPMGMDDLVMDAEEGEKTCGADVEAETTPSIAPYRIKIEVIEDRMVPEDDEDPDSELEEVEFANSATIYYEDGRPQHIVLESDDTDQHGSITLDYDFLDLVRDMARAGGKRIENGMGGQLVAVRGYYG